MVEMTDFYSVLQRAVASLPDGSGPQRRAVYDKARKALLKQLQSFDPPLPSADVTAQRLALEDAIRKIENEIARQIRTRRAVQGAMPAASSATPRQPAASSASARPAAEVPARIAPPPASTPEPARTPEVQAELLESAVSEATAAPREEARVQRLAPAAPPPVVLPPDDEPHPDEDARMFEEEAEEDVAPRSRRRARRQNPVYEEEEPQEVEYEHVEEEATADDRADFDDEDADEVPQARDRRRRGARESRRELRAERRAARASRKEAKRKPRVERAGRSLVSRIALPLVVLVLLGAASYAALTQRDALMAVLESFENRSPETRDPIVAAAPGSEKNDDRLPSIREGEDTRTVTTTPWSPDGPETETTGVTESGPARSVGEDAVPFRSDPAESPAESQVAAVDPAASRSGDDAPEAAEAPVDRPVGVQQAVLYEEAQRQGEPGPAVPGSVEWSMVRQSVGGGEPEPVVRASAAIPERNMTATLTIRENRDAGLPASHLIEIEFEVPPSFEGGGVKNVPGIIMKESEQSRGEPLRGAAARVSSGLFWIALSEDPNDRQYNLELLARRDWIDIPILYESGRRAILTLRKGSDGFQSVDAALRAWSPG